MLTLWCVRRSITSFVCHSIYPPWNSPGRWNPLPGSQQVQFINARHQIWKLREIYFQWKMHLCVGLSIWNIFIIIKYRKGFIIFVYYARCILNESRHSNTGPFNWLLINCMNFELLYSMCGFTHISKQKCWSDRKLTLIIHVHKSRKCTNNHGYPSRK